MLKRKLLQFWLSVMICLTIAPLAKADPFFMQCQVKAEGIRNLLASDLCKLDENWAFKSAEWNISQGCCAPVLASQPSEGSGISVRLKQTVSKDKVAPFSEAIDKELMTANVRFSLDSSPFNFVPNLNIVFYDAGGNWIEAIDSDANLYLSSTLYSVNVPAGTRSLDFEVIALDTDKICYDGFVLYLEESYSRGILSLYTKINNIANYAIFASIIIVPFLIMVLCRNSSPFPIPINLLKRRKDNRISLLLFGMVAQLIFVAAINVIYQTNYLQGLFTLSPTVAKYTQGIFLILQVLLEGMTLYPLFLCYEQSHKLIGSVLGFFVSSAILVQFFTEAAVHYYSGMGISRIMFVIALVPVIIFNLILVLYFLACIFSAKPSASQELVLAYVSDFRYVKDLLVDKPMEFKVTRAPPSFIESICHPRRFMDYRRYKRDFVRNIEIPDVIHFTLLTITLVVVQVMIFALVYIQDLVQDEGACTVTTAIYTANNLSGHISDILTTTSQVLLSMQLSTYLAVLLGGFGIIYFTSEIKYRFQRDLVQLRLGNYSLFHNRKSNDIDINNYLAFYGSALGNAFFACLVFIGQLFLVLVLISAVILIPYIRTMIIRWFLLSSLTPFLISWIIGTLASFITRYLFIIPGTKFWLRRRSGFMHWSYFATFVYIPSGITGWFARMIQAFFTIFLFSSRVDRSVLHVNLRSKDSGYNSYLGLLLVEHYYYNPINLVFICVMLGMPYHEAPLKSNGFQWRRLVRPPSIFLDEKDVEKQDMRPVTIIPRLPDGQRRIARNRWHLAYTLINNPKVRDLRRHGTASYPSK